MNTIAQIVATSNATTDIAYYVCIVSFFIAGGVAIYLLWDKTKQTSGGSKTRVVKPTTKRPAAKKTAAKKTTAKKAPAKKRTTKTTKKK